MLRYGRVLQLDFTGDVISIREYRLASNGQFVVCKLFWPIQESKEIKERKHRETK